jgi:hypothetical protein
MSNPYKDFRKAVVEKLKRLTWLALSDPEDEESKIIFDSDFSDSTSFPDSKYPCIEVFQGFFGPDIYESQTGLQGSTDILVKAFMKQDLYEDGQPKRTENMDTLMDRSVEALNLIYSFNEDKELGNPPCEGFIFIEGFSEVHCEPHLDGNMMGFFFAFSARIINITTPC